ncbi:phage Gp37/Gp68 family protein [Burkholderia pseudomallei]|uniref:phage Gp37/Gp68 family protein n=2 Tax=Burkholderia pseudomallei TaxID=28450 RepID=UPI000F05B5F6|nr:phage Gp37/Gp68 family protein [Burkholderia pseudomallei]CAJ3168142.1 Bacteriophage protein gp37 [Burkholderia pseudomallei]CAJ4172484.1 Bacteriophage protein gp37 [Burkholderia pseudomallei]CAJ6469915.1 Bacteriophage protein gp37 [Burkholderia pseudomallei]CAJ9499123.1 Bacteriophage protein gp37 [Burkholderia pseudomallei]VBC39610.1 Bacteriophage protein gp37 [Burkholderia pseudomallei]
MSENSKIEWCDHTFNPWEGCQKVGPGCDHCYAEARNARFGGGSAVNWGPGAPRRRTSAANWRKPLAWNAAHEQFFAAHGRRQRVFCSSLADVFDNAVYPMWRVDLFELISNTPNLDWLLLTKRIGNARDMISSVLGSIMRDEREWPWPHVWLGATIVNQAEADRDIPKLLAVPARVRFLSMEPLLGPVDLRFHIYSEPTGNFRTHGGKRQLELRRPADGGLHWVIAGGESGHGARPMHPDWARSLRDQCAAAGVPFLFKQWGEWAPRTTDEQKLLPVPCSRTTSWPDGTVGCGDYQSNGDYGKCLFRVGKKATGRMLDGRRHDEFPEVTR